MDYSDKLVDHFRNPRNVGDIPDADGVGVVGDPNCGDFLKVSIKVDGDRVSDVKFLCQGCPAAIATASIATELAIGKNLDDAAEITADEIAAVLGGLPEHKMHCSNLAAEGLQGAIMDHVLNYPRRVMEKESGDSAS